MRVAAPSVNCLPQEDRLEASEGKSGDNAPSVIPFEGGHDDDPLQAFAPEQSLAWHLGRAIAVFNPRLRQRYGLDVDRAILRLLMIAVAGLVSVALALVVAGIRSPSTKPYASLIRNVPTGDVVGLRGVEELSATPLPLPAVADIPAERRSDALAPVTPVTLPPVLAPGNLHQQTEVRATSRVNHSSPVEGDSGAQGPPAAFLRPLAAAAQPRLSEERDAATATLPARPLSSAVSEGAMSAPAATTEASPEPSAPPVPGHSPDQSAILAVIGQYRRAFSSLDVAAAAAVWPTLDRKALDRAFSQLSEQSFDFSGCEISVNGQLGVASCTGQARSVRKISSRTAQVVARHWNFTLRKSNDHWVIESVRSR
jgi:hypothetical protein